jgi:hypothetical protein
LDTLKDFDVVVWPEIQSFHERRCVETKVNLVRKLDEINTTRNGMNELNPYLTIQQIQIQIDEDKT